MTTNSITSRQGQIPEKVLRLARENGYEEVVFLDNFRDKQLYDAKHKNSKPGLKLGLPKLISWDSENAYFIDRDELVEYCATLQP